MNVTRTTPALDIEELGTVILVPKVLIRPFPDQPRKFFDQQKLKELAASIKAVGQKVPGFVRELESDNGSRHKYELVDGQRRWHALDIAGIEKMKVIVLDVKDVEEQFLISVVSNFGRADHGPLEIANAISRFKNNGMTVTEIAEVFARSDAWIYQHLKIIEKLHPEVQAMMSQELPEEDRLVFSIALVIADVPADLQKKIADTIVGEKLKMIQAKDFIRRRAEKMGFSVGNPERTPRRDYEIMRNFIGKMRRELEVFTQLPQSFFDKMFQFRENEDHSKILLAMERNIEDLKILATAMMRVKK